MMSLHLSAVARGPRVPQARLTSLPYDSLRLRFRPSPPQDKPGSSLYGWVPFIRSSGTNTVSLSGNQSVYRNGERAGSSPHPGNRQEVAGGDVGAWEYRRNDFQRLKDLDLHGNGIGSRNSSSRKALGLDKVSSDRDREELQLLASTVTTSKPSSLRVNGFKNNVLRADHYLSQRSHGSAGQEEDLVAMGKLWTSSHQVQPRGSSITTIITSTTTTTTSSTSSIKPVSATFSGNGISGSGSGGFSAGTPPTYRPVQGIAPSWHTYHHPPSLAAPAMGNVIKSTKDADPKYSDPVAGAPSAFHQRLTEMAALEAETVRWERGKKVKKKPAKQDS